jgi:hypothetical protein
MHPDQEQTAQYSPPHIVRVEDPILLAGSAFACFAFFITW